MWSSSGTLLASGTFSGETASGWQELDFSSPVAVTAGTTYVASYFTSTGYPASTPQGLASAVTNGPLTALAGGGVYAYGSSNTFPAERVQQQQLLGRRGVLDDVGCHGAGGAGGGDRGRGERVGDGELDGAEQWGQRDHQLYGDAVCGVGGADGGDGVREPAGHAQPR